jgi:hypothetical protein
MKGGAEPSEEVTSDDEYEYDDLQVVDSADDIDGDDDYIDGLLGRVTPKHGLVELGGRGEMAQF